MSFIEIIYLAVVVYLLIGGLCATFAAQTGSVRMVLFAFACWPLIAWHGLKMLIGRARR